MCMKITHCHQGYFKAGDTLLKRSSLKSRCIEDKRMKKGQRHEWLKLPTQRTKRKLYLYLIAQKKLFHYTQKIKYLFFKYLPCQFNKAQMHKASWRQPHGCSSILGCPALCYSRGMFILNGYAKVQDNIQGMST